MAECSIEATIQTAIDRAGEAMLEVDGIEITDIVPEIRRWAVYSDQLRDMADNWEDIYPLATELQRLLPSELRSLWERVIGLA